MDTNKLISAILQLVALAPTAIPSILKAIQSLKDLIDSGHEVTAADINNLVSGIKSQSDEIQKL